MQHYELTYIVPMSFTVDEVPAINQKITKLLTEHGATNIKETNLGKLKLAYQIAGFSHGYYSAIECDLETNQMSEINRSLQLSTDILRFLFLKKRIKTDKEIASEQRLKEKIARQDVGRRNILEDEDEEAEMITRKKPYRSAPRKEEETVDIADLDKKLDAILGGEDMLK